MTIWGNSPSHPTVGILGGFGGGNIGNDGSADVAIAHLRQKLPDVELCMISLFPSGARQRYGLDTQPMWPGASAAVGVRSRWLRLLLAFVLEIVTLPRQYAKVRSLDAIIVPGTGILDDFGEPAWGMPGALFKWALLARLAGRPVHLVSIGAGPVVSPLNRRLLAAVARMATTVSYRDGWSRRYAMSAGYGHPDQRVTSDISFGRGTYRVRPALVGQAPAGSPLTVGIGVMAYGGWSGESEGPVYEHYIRTTSRVVDRLLEDGHDIRFLVGQQIDDDAVDAVLAGCRHPGAAHAFRSPIATFDDLLIEIDQTDAVIATRYHHLVAATLMRRPMISLSYAAKNAELLAALGWADRDMRIEDADTEWVLARFRDVVDGPWRGHAFDHALDRWRAATEDELDRVAGTLRPQRTMVGIR